MKEEDFDLSKHNRSEPLVAMTVIWRKSETFKRGRQYRHWRLDVSNLWKKISLSQKKPESFSNEEYFRAREFCTFFRAIIIFKIYFYIPRMGNTFVQILAQI